MMTKMLQKKSIKLKCPHCKREIHEAWICEMDSVIGLRYAYICSSCEKLLAISSSKESSLFINANGGDIDHQLRDKV
jgi:hypothetical protein